MSDKQEKEVRMRRMISEFMEGQLADVKEFRMEDNNSFAFLEKGTLNLLLTYMLLGEKRSTNEVVDEEFDRKVLAKLDKVIENNKKEFEDIISYLKKLS